jgi:hypothetical protein
MSKITFLQVYYSDLTRKILLAEITFSIPDNMELENPDGSFAETFLFHSNGPIGAGNDVIMNFKVIKKSEESNGENISVERKAILVLDRSFTSTHKTTVILRKADGAEEGRKSQNGDDYIEDPDKEYGEEQ